MISYELFEATMIHDLVVFSDYWDNDKGMYRDNDGSIIIVKENVSITFEQHTLFPGYTICRRDVGGGNWATTCLYANNENFIKKFCAKYNIPISLDDDELAAIKNYKRRTGFGHLRDTWYYAKWRLNISDSMLNKIFEQSKREIQSALRQSAARFQKIVELNESFMRKIKNWSVRPHNDIYHASIYVGEKGVTTFELGYGYPNTPFLFKDIGLRDLKSEEEKIGVALAIYTVITKYRNEFDPPYIEISHGGHPWVPGDEWITININGKENRILSEW